VTVSFAILIGLPIAWLTTELLEIEITANRPGPCLHGVLLGCLITAEEGFMFQKRADARCFRKISVLLDKGDVDTVKRAVAPTTRMAIALHWPPRRSCLLRMGRIDLIAQHGWPQSRFADALAWCMPGRYADLAGLGVNRS